MPIETNAVDAPSAAGASSLEVLETLLGHRFRNRMLLELALTHSSVAYEKQAERDPEADNERMEFLGDAVVGLAVTDHLFRRYKDFSEGQLTQLRAQLVSSRHLGRAAGRLQLGNFLRLGRGEERSGGRRKSAILADAVEALVAAVYLDSDMEAAAKLTRRLLIGPDADALAAAIRAGTDIGDSKSTLQEYLQTHGLGQPEYRVLSEAGPDHSKSFVVEVKISDSTGISRTLASASGFRKKSAEQEAARLALICLRRSEPQSLERAEHV